MPLTPKDVANIALPPASVPQKSRVPTDKFKRFDTLTLEQRAVVDNMLQRSTVPKVAAMIQKDWKIWTDISTFSLEQLLRRYKDEYIHAQMTAAVTRLQKKSGPAAQAIQYFGEQLNVIEELTSLVDVQKERLAKILKKLESNELPNKGVREELDLLMKMLREVGNLQLETGIMRRAPKEIKGTLTNGVDTPVEFRIEESYSPALQKVLDDAKRIIDGTYEEIEEDDDDGGAPGLSTGDSDPPSPDDVDDSGSGGPAAGEEQSDPDP